MLPIVVDQLRSENRNFALPLTDESRRCAA